MNVRSDHQGQEVLPGGAFSPVCFLLEKDPFALLDDLHPYLVHNCLSTEPGDISPNRLTPIRIRAFSMMIPRAMRTHNRNDPRGDAANKRNDGRSRWRVVRFHDRLKRAVKVVLPGLQSVEVVSKS